MLIGSRNISLPLSLLGCLMIGSLTYFTVQLISARKKTMTDLAMQLGVRSLKRRRSRTILTLITITIIVSSAIVFVNISMNRDTRIREQWAGTDTSGVIIIPNTYQTQISKYDINWIRSQQWCGELSYVESVLKLEDDGTAMDIIREGFLETDDQQTVVEILGVDLDYMEEHYQISEKVTGFWDRFLKGEQVAIIPTNFGIMTNEPITLGAIETLAERVEVPFGEFHVVATFDPQTAFSNLVKIDGSSLFENASMLVLVPTESINSPAFTISEITVLTKPGVEPLDVAQELAYTLVAETIANKEGVSQRIVWSTEFSITGLIPCLPPLIIAGLMMYTTMFSVYEERKKEFTTLATLGLDPHNAFQVFLVEALLLGSMGTFIGFFGSYILGAGLFYLASFLNTPELSELVLPFTHWSMPAILVALLTGVIMVFLGGFIPAIKAQGISLMGREQKREMIGELISSEGVTSLTLPIRETVRNGEMLFSYVRETIGKFKASLVDPPSVKGELYRDGTFRVSFIALADMYRVTVPCEIKGVRKGEILVPVIEFPTSYKSYERIRLVIRDLEQYMIGFSAWKEMQLKMTIVREAPRRQKTIEEIMTEIKDVVNQVKDCGKKLKILNGQKGKLSEEVFNEFREKYIKMINEKSKSLRTMTINLEPHHKEIQEEINKIEVEVERITTAYSLGEITEEEYVKTSGPPQQRLAELRERVAEMEEIFDFLKKPLGAEYM
jgi:ABC-type antimicrobial peptide transport system permease subunit